MKKIGKAFWITLGLGSLFFIILIILSSVLQLGERLATITPYLAYAFYGISGILFFLLILRPISLIVFSPTFSMDSLFTEEQNAKKNFSMYKKVSMNLVNDTFLSDDEKASITDSLNDPLALKQSLSIVFDKTIKKELNKLIVKHAETVFLSTAISQNGRLDSLAVITINLKLIKELVLKCGFRPSYSSLGRLSFNVLTSAVIAESLEDINFNEIFPSKGLNALAEIPFLKTIIGSFAQGVGNALLSLRVGIICRNYLFMNLKGVSKSQIRKMAFAEAVLLLPSVLAESVKKLPKRFKTLFEKVF
ncbi:MAG: YcjF family protein [Firmicutes bacterium]|nr:YcjF family protein [Bacillota bacterium]